MSEALEMLVGVGAKPIPAGADSDVFAMGRVCDAAALRCELASGMREVVVLFRDVGDTVAVSVATATPEFDVVAVDSLARVTCVTRGELVAARFRGPLLSATALLSGLAVPLESSSPGPGLDAPLSSIVTGSDVPPMFSVVAPKGESTSSAAFGVAGEPRGGSCAGVFGVLARRWESVAVEDVLFATDSGFAPSPSLFV